MERNTNGISKEAKTTIKMKNEEPEKTVFMAVIAGRELKDALLTVLTDSGIHLVDSYHARGTVRTDTAHSLLGLAPEEKRIVITCLSTQSKTDAVLARLAEEFHFDKPHTGIAFTVPIDKVSY